MIRLYNGHRSSGCETVPGRPGSAGAPARPRSGCGWRVEHRGEQRDNVSGLLQVRAELRASAQGGLVPTPLTDRSATAPA